MQRRTTCLTGAVLMITAAAAGAASPSPHQACYESARSGDTAPYACDLAIEAARGMNAAALLAAALANRALVFGNGGQLDAALEDLNAALNLLPDDAALHGNRGNLLLRLGRPAEALAAHDRAVQLRPDDPLHRYNRAFSYRALGDPARAARAIAALAGEGADAELRPADRSAADAGPAR